jgi:hypothetical protein
VIGEIVILKILTLLQLILIVFFHHHWFIR